MLDAPSSPSGEKTDVAVVRVQAAEMFAPVFIRLARDVYLLQDVAAVMRKVVDDAIGMVALRFAQEPERCIARTGA
ncbi:hypothetical protein [Xanthomonas hydrangeae]|uniref:hypothetical protein n=1 Tax=Xanthomonas hydrangeae TaxID=2775159 RepID=UPI0019626382